MEWFTNIASSLSGLPWWAILLVVLLSIACTKGIEALLRVWGFQLDWKKYTDAQQKVRDDALVEELKKRIDKLESIVDTQTNKLDIATAAHTKCEIEQERLRGDLNVMKEKVAMLERHDATNKEHTEQLKAETQRKAEEIKAETEAKINAKIEEIKKAGRTSSYPTESE
jgi:predicted  nucleic acid-binding Zn-ribbon protein